MFNLNYNDIKKEDKETLLFVNALKVFELIKNDASITRKELALKINKSERTVDRLIKELKYLNLIEEKTSKKGGIWVILI